MAALELRERALASFIMGTEQRGDSASAPAIAFFSCFYFFIFFSPFFPLFTCVLLCHTHRIHRAILCAPPAPPFALLFSCILSSQLVRLVWIAPALRLSARRSLCAFRRVAFSISWMTSASPLLVVCWRCCCGTTSVLVEFGNSSFPKLLPAMVLVPQSGCVSVWERAYLLSGGLGEARFAGVSFPLDAVCPLLRRAGPYVLVAHLRAHLFSEPRCSCIFLVARSSRLVVVDTGFGRFLYRLLG